MLKHWPEGAQRIIDARTVAQALDRQAERLERRMGGEPALVLAVMTGGMYPAVELSRRLKLPLRLDYVHATRYRGGTSGGEVDWVRKLDRLPMDRPVVLVDDIFDEGYTLEAIATHLLHLGVPELITAVLCRKMHDRGLPRDSVSDWALEVPDRYVFGCGMDYHGYWRQLDEIWALTD